ncbi:ThiF family adenylyltransferase [uncultured Porphyromonas sp.]|uniref:HesA/MoeB/ThiF family protein n=1 Tax=uncultured Porphyromonas sp. TaxID=159274 RepID=UPI00260E0CBE|nr:ThiF family adenylyltransferase [uncultured Porphyromonas sp.]
MKRYERNRIYISDEEQMRIKDFRVLLAGAGIGSNIAETLLRIGFETITLVDGDVVEESNLNRQNYTEEDVKKPKVEALKKRLLSINPNAQISTINTFINHENVRDIIVGHDVAINTLDFKSDIPFVFDHLCAEHGIYVLHPYNIGFAGIVMVVSPDGANLESLLTEGESYLGYEKRAIQYITDYFNYWVRPKIWIEDIIRAYEKEKMLLPPPQLSIASSLVGGICTSILIRIVRGEFVKIFPKFYYYSEYDDLN